MKSAADLCWVAADGALRSGTEVELAASIAAGELPAENPVWRQSWPEWVPLSDAFARGWLDEHRFAAPPSTERKPMRFEDPSSPAISAPGTASRRTVVDVALPAHMEHGFDEDEITVPRGPTPVPLTLRSYGPPPPSARSIAPVSSSIVPPPALRPTLVGAAIALGGVAVTTSLVGALALSRPDPVRSAMRTSVAAATPVRLPAKAPPATSGCKLLDQPLSVTERAQPYATLAVARGSSPGRIAVGLATTEKGGFGFVLGTDPLRVVSREVVGDPVHVGGVVPSSSSDGSTRFTVDRWWSTLRTDPPISIGVTPKGFSRIDASGTIESIWPGAAREAVSRPAIARSANGDFAIAFRRGEQDNGSVHFGWLDTQGMRRSELATLSEGAARVDAPSLGVNGSSAAIALTERRDGRSEIRVALARSGAQPDSIRAVPTETAADPRAPSIAPLADGGWLLAWLEGDKSAGYKLRARSLDAELTPRSSAFTLFSSAGPVASTAMVGDGKRVVALFAERSGRAFDRLWAVAVQCD